MKKSLPLLLAFVLLAALFLVTTLSVQAEPRTIVVPDYYSTIEAAIANANDGDIIFVRKGIYPEHSLVVNKTITLRGEGADNSTIINIDERPVWDRDLYPIFPPSSPTAIKINGNNVKVSGFTISGIDQDYVPLSLLADGAKIEDNVVVAGSSLKVGSNGNTIARNRMTNIELIGSHNNVLCNKLTGNASIEGVIHLTGSHNLVFGNTITDMAVYFNTGISIEGDNNIVAKNNLTCSGIIEIEVGSNNIIFGNKLVNSGGLHITVGANNVLFANHVENAGIGTVIGGYSRRALNNTLYHNNFINNTSQVFTSYGGDDSNHFDNGKEGNYWSDYSGSDANGDGIGDTSYSINY